MISTYFDCEGDETSLTQCEVVHDHGGCDTGQATVSCHAPDGKKFKKYMESNLSEFLSRVIE